MKLPNIAVRERRGLRAVPWRYLSADFAYARFADMELGTVTLIARTPDPDGIRRTFGAGRQLAAVFDAVAPTVAEAAREAVARYRAAAAPPEDFGLPKVATLPADAVKTARDVARAAGSYDKTGGVILGAGLLVATDGGMLFAAEAPGVSGPDVHVPPEALKTFAGGDVRADETRVSAGPYCGRKTHVRTFDYAKLLATRGEGWTVETDGAELVGFLRTAGDAVTLGIKAGRLSLAGAEAETVIDARGGGDGSRTARLNTDRLRAALRFVGSTGPVRLAVVGPNFVRIEGRAADRCAIVATLRERVPAGCST